MTKFASCLTLLLGLCGVVRAATTVTVACQELLLGSETLLQLKVSTDQTNLLAFQMELTLPEGFTLSATGDGQVDVALKDVTTHDVTGAKNGSSYMFVCKSDANTPLPEAFVVELKLKADERVETGSTYTGKVQGVLFSQKEGTTHKGLSVADESFDMMVKRLELSETQSEDLTEYRHVGINMERSIAADEWSTICLPFDMTEDQVKAAFGDGVELADFKGYEVQRQNGQVTGIVVKFKTVGNCAIEANHPYIIKVKSDVSAFTLDGVDVSPVESPMVAAATRTSSQWSEMKGTYDANTIVPANCLFLNDNMFWYSTGKTRMKAYRAYFDFSDVLSTLDATAVRLLIDDDLEATSLKSSVVSRDESDGRFYNLNGQRVSRPSKGIYIVKGKKVVLK